MQDGSPAEPAIMHQALIDYLKETNVLTIPAVEQAFRTVPRHLFLPGLPLTEVYQDQAITTKVIGGRFVSSSSQPSIMAIMLEQLDLQAGQRVLEIGAGTGYNAALLSHIIGKTGQVVTIDIDDDIVSQARYHLQQAGFSRVRVVKADGALGFEELAPYDRIILTVNAADIAPAWRAQLTAQGRLLMPLSLRGPQLSVAFDRVDEHFRSVSLRACGFVDLRGSLAETANVILLHQGGISLRSSMPSGLKSEDLWNLLQGSYQEMELPLVVGRRELSFGLVLWLSLRQPTFYELFAYDQFAEQEYIPYLFQYSGKMRMRTTFGLLEAGTLSALLWHESLQTIIEGETALSSLKIRWYGPSRAVAEKLRSQILAWDAAGRPTEEKLHIDAYPITNQTPPGEGIIIRKRYTEFIYHW